MPPDPDIPRLSAKLPCPRCRELMHVARLPTKTGYCLLLDQCIRCGGVWCDRWELYPLSAASAEALDDADYDALLLPVAPSSSPLNCPRCRIELAQLSDPGFPADANVQRCRRCEGMWLNRGELRRMKRRDRSRVRPVHSQTMLEAMPIVGRLEDATRQVVDAGDPDDLGSGLIAGGAWVAVRLLLRWFVGL